MSEFASFFRKAGYGSQTFFAKRSEADENRLKNYFFFALRESMKLHKHSLSAMITASVFSVAAFQVHAQTGTPGVDQRQAKQSQRIAKGEASGRLSSQEAARMKAGQANVASMEANAKADGKVTRAERKAIHKEQNKQSRRIYRQKHDGNKR
jgi:hypothetical protein